MRSPRRAFVCLFLFAAFALGTLLILTGPARSGPAQRAPGKDAIEQNNVGVGYMNQYLYKQAASCFEKALSIDPRFNLARINFGIALFYDGQLERAAEVLRQALTRDPKDPHANFCLGMTLKDLGELEPAEPFFRRVLESDPDSSPAWYNLGIVYSRRQKSSEAETAWRRALELDPQNTSAMYNLGNLFLKTGRPEEGKEMLERFRKSQKGGSESGSTGAGMQYGEMGEYALVQDYLPSANRSDQRTTATGAKIAPFVDRTEEAGLLKISNTESRTPFATQFPAGDYSLEFLKARVLGALGGGIALGDLAGDGHIDAVVTRYNAQSRSWETFVLRNDGKGHFADITESSGIRNSGSQISAAIGDYDNDGLQDVYLVGLGGNTLYRNLGNGKFRDVTAEAGAGDRGLCVSATFVDYDHDGDLDLYVSHFIDVSQKPQGDPLTFPDSFAGEPNRMFRNNGNGTFTDVTDTLKVGGGKAQHFGMTASDVDNDRDIDLVVINRGSQPQIFSNERNDTFTDISAKAGIDAAVDVGSMTIADFNRDGAMDLFLAPARSGSSVLLLNRGNGTFTRDTRSEDLMRAPSALRFGSGALDYDSDGAMDLYLFRNDGGELWRNTGDGRFVFGGSLPCSNGRAAASADFDGDGRPDIMVLERQGALHLLKNLSATENHWLGIRLEGLRSNKFAFGAKVEVRAGELYQKMEVQGHNGYLSQDSSTLWIGLGQAAQADTVTVRWPSGILQSEVNVPADQVVHIRELNRKGTSCPLLYTWNGTEFEFVTDFLGGCAIGALEAPHRYSIPDTDEYVRIEGSQLVPRDGRYLLNLNNQLEEVIMFDQAQLLAVDHPAGTEIYPNERLLPEPPFPEYRIYTANGARPPVSAVDDSGTDILPLISAKDRVYPDSFRLLPFKGYAETHSMTLDLGDLKGARKILLLMDAWIDYADSSSNLAASQAGLQLRAPYLQVKDAAGRWETVIPEMGFPAGLPKTMTVDLTGRFLSNDHHVRIVTNMCIYWDRIRVDTSAEAPIRVTRLDPVSADLHFRGYPTYFSPDGKLPWIYDYRRIQPAAAWGTHAGAYTRFGDVLQLLLKRDDEYVITCHGDEITLGFDAGKVPPLSDRWVRDYLLYVDGYGKDMDINALYPEVVGPLPFHSMSVFPYPLSEKYPDDAEHQKYRKLYNTRIYPAERAVIAPHH